MELLKIITALLACGSALAIPIILMNTLGKRGQENKK